MARPKTPAPLPGSEPTPPADPVAPTPAPLPGGIREFVADLACPTQECGAFHHVHNPGGSVYLVDPKAPIICKNCGAAYPEANIIRATKPHVAA